MNKYSTIFVIILTNRNLALVGTLLLWVLWSEILDLFTSPCNLEPLPIVPFNPSLCHHHLILSFGYMSLFVLWQLANTSPFQISPSFLVGLSAKPCGWVTYPDGSLFTFTYSTKWNLTQLNFGDIYGQCVLKFINYCTFWTHYVYVLDSTPRKKLRNVDRVFHINMSLELVFKRVKIWEQWIL